MLRTTITFFAAVISAASLFASNPVRIEAGDGYHYSIEACSEGVFHVRISPRDTFPESLMERYGVVRTDWSPVDCVVSEENDRCEVAVGDYRLSVSEDTGIINVYGKDGTVKVGGIRFRSGSNDLSCSLAEIINGKYASMHVPSNGGIIGDDDGRFSEKDKAESGDPDKSSVISFELKDDDRFYGGGSTSRDHIQHRGEMLRMWTTYVNTEIPMPFVLSSNGWGVYDNSTRKSFFDIAYTSEDTFNIYDTCDEADFYLFVGEGMPDIIDKYTQVTGRTYVLPKWAYGLCFGPNMRENQWDILNDAVHFRQADVPCDLFWLEPQWMSKRYDFSTQKKFNSQNFSVEPYWVENQYPKKLHNRLFVGKLRSMGYHLGLWLCEEYDLSIAEEDEVAVREGRDTSGLEHWMDHLKTFMDLGVEGFKLDPARTIDEHTFFRYYNGHTDKEMHNLNQVLLPKQMARLGRSYNGKRTWHHYCGGWSGTQHWGASTSGDNGGGKTALFDQINLGMSGFFNTSCDVMSVERELEMQSLHFGTFLPWIQINSWFSMMQPFYYNAEEQQIYRNNIKFRYNILPYIYSCALEATMDGMPIVRSMPLCFPADSNVEDMAYQYMFGPAYCVGIFTDRIYLPEGLWYNAWTGESLHSDGETATMVCPKDRAGVLMVRGGSIIPCLKEEVQYIGTEPIDAYNIRVYPGVGKAAYTMYDSDAESYGYEEGLVASTLFESQASDYRHISFTANPVQGSFENMPATRNYSVTFYGVRSKPSKVTVDGVRTKAWTYSPSDGSLTVEAGIVPVGNSLTVNVRL